MTIAPTPARRPTRLPAPAIVAVVAAATATLSLLRRQPLSWDEAVTVAVATRPVSAIAATVHHSDAVLGAYYLLMHGWSAALHGVGITPTEIWWRLPSAAAAVGTCVVTAACARRIAGTGAGVLAGGALAVLPLFAFYTVDARPYTPAALLVVLGWWTWTGPAGRRPRSRAVVVTALLIAAAWLQLFTVLVWPAFLLVGGRGALRRGLTVVVAAGLATAPLLAVAVTQSHEIGWIPAASAANTGDVALHVGGGVGVVLGVGVVVALAVRAGQVHRSPMTLAVLWWTLAPFAVLAALDVVRPVLVARYALVSLPLAAVGFAVVVVRSAPGRRGPAVRVVAALTLVAAVVTSGWQGTRPFKYEDYRSAAAYAARSVPVGTPVLFAPSSARLGFDAYLPASRLVDVALPGGVGADPLTITELPTPAVRAAVDADCVAVVVGDPLPPGRSGLAGLGPAAVAGWDTHQARSFGQVTVTVVADPRCRSAATGRA